MLITSSPDKGTLISYELNFYPFR